MKIKITFLFVALMITLTSCVEEKKEKPEQKKDKLEEINVTPVLHNIYVEEGTGKLYLLNKNSNKKYFLKKTDPFLTISNFNTVPEGNISGVEFDFKQRKLDGRLYYGLINEDTDHPYPVYYKEYAALKSGRAQVDIAGTLAGKHDIANWEQDGNLMLGYRVTNKIGEILYDGKVNLSGKGPFEVQLSITEGPFVFNVKENSAVISFKTNMPQICEITVEDKSFASDSASLLHEIKIDGLEPDKKYNYTINYGENKFESYFNTFPEKGKRSETVFAFASDSRNAAGGGERNIYGVNSYIMKKLSALAYNKSCDFFLFTGDLIDGYLQDRGEQQLQYTNWKRTIEPYAHSMPYFVGMGNHESLNFSFDDGSKYGLSVNRFPYMTESGEALFNSNFANPLNGPGSEDGSVYDPNPDKTDFPPYKENVYYFVHGNTAVIVLNSNYLYSPSRRSLDKMGGNLHGYIMDQQLEWFEKTVEKFENDRDIDHIFVTFHTPVFPNGGHTKDDMWYHGDNRYRPYIGGKALEKGIIERRDDILNIMVNKSSKVRAVLAGDEHNYSRTEISKGMDIYPEGWKKDRIKIKRTIWQITNGAAGAPYYSQEITPWTENVRKFTAQYALVLFRIKGGNISVEVWNPDTMSLIEKFDMK